MKGIKVVIVGDTKVGKTCIAFRFIQGQFDDNTNPTVGAAFLTKVVQTSSGSVRLQLWDTAGQEKFRTLAPMYYRSSKVAILVYDITNRKSFDSANVWANDITEKSPQQIKIILVGNKCDQEEARVISKEAGQKLATEIGAAEFTEVSALNGIGILELFNNIAEKYSDDLPTEATSTTSLQGTSQPNKKGCC